MGCGFHHCERLCHNDECGNCSAPCGKARKSWYVPHDKKLLCSKQFILNDTSKMVEIFFKTGLKEISLLRTFFCRKITADFFAEPPTIKSSNPSPLMSPTDTPRPKLIRVPWMPAILVTSPSGATKLSVPVSICAIVWRHFAAIMDDARLTMRQGSWALPPKTRHYSAARPMLPFMAAKILDYP